jgi:2-polyprenyl-6-methoxyphenol hydroxylase-like FAD-dependent oxidoreductase
MIDGDLDTDVLIIGSGPIGSAFARLLAPTGRRVTMIDAGAQLSPAPGSHLGNAFIYQQDPNLFASLWQANLQRYSSPVGSDYLNTLDSTA